MPIEQNEAQAKAKWTAHKVKINGIKVARLAHSHPTEKKNSKQVPLDFPHIPQYYMQCMHLIEYSSSEWHKHNLI